MSTIPIDRCMALNCLCASSIRAGFLAPSLWAASISSMKGFKSANLFAGGNIPVFLSELGSGGVILAAYFAASTNATAFFFAMASSAEQKFLSWFVDVTSASSRYPLPAFTQWALKTVAIRSMTTPTG